MARASARENHGHGPGPEGSVTTPRVGDTVAITVKTVSDAGGHGLHLDDDQARCWKLGADNPCSVASQNVTRRAMTQPLQAGGNLPVRPGSLA
jgi:hypothetical protein